MELITNEFANHLLGLPKKIASEGKLLPKITIEQKFPFSERFKLLSEKENEYAFLWEIRQSSKDNLRITLHLQENNSKIGLTRIDYGSPHKNPNTVNDFVPENFRKYRGKKFEHNEPHIHCYVQGYKSLVWAIPLADHDFEIKAISDKNVNSSIFDVIKSFAKMINVKTVISIKGVPL